MSQKRSDNKLFEATVLPDHHTTNYFTLDKSFCEKNAAALENLLQELNGLFDTIGTKFTITNYILTIDVNMDKFRSVTTRKAGRKKKEINKQYEEIREYQKTHTTQETWEWLGLTRQTYYRKLKELKEKADKSHN